MDTKTPIWNVATAQYGPSMTMTKTLIKKHKRQMKVDMEQKRNVAQRRSELVATFKGFGGAELLAVDDSKWEPKRPYHYPFHVMDSASAAKLIALQPHLINCATRSLFLCRHPEPQKINDDLCCWCVYCEDDGEEDAEGNHDHVSIDTRFCHLHSTMPDNWSFVAIVHYDADAMKWLVRESGRVGDSGRLRPLRGAEANLIPSRYL